MRLTITLFLLAFGWHSCLLAQKVNGNGQVKSTTRAVDNFKGLEVNGVYEIELTQGDGVIVQVVADENLQDLITVETSDGILVVSSDSRLNDPTELKLLIGSDIFNYIELNGAAELSGTTPLYGESLRMKLNGAAAVDLALAYEEVTTDISGASSLKLVGEAQKVAHSISGAGSIQAFGLKATNVTVDISGTGSAQVDAEKSLVADISGMGSIVYTGSPDITKDISGLGSLRKQ